MIVDYADSDASSDDAPSTSTAVSLKSVNPAPAVAVKEDVLKQVAVVVKEPKDHIGKINYNPKYEELYAPEEGPEHPFKSKTQKSAKNITTGYAEPVHVSDFHFDNQRKTFHSYGFAVDPSEDAGGNEVVGDLEAFSEQKGASVFEAKSTKGAKRKRIKNDDPSDIDNYTGPWAKYEGEKTVSVPDEEDQKWLDEYHAQKTKVKKNRKDWNSREEELKPVDEKSILHLKEPVDYQGRSFMHPPQDVGVNLKSEYPPDRCFLPKKHIYTWQGHTKGIQVMRFFPRYGHLFLTGGMDSKIKLWEMYNERRCVRTFLGHTLGVRDVCFNNDGSRFISASYDRWAKLWDTETGQCIHRFTTKCVPYCVRFNPDPNRQHFFLAGQQNKKVVCWDTRSNQICQEYDRHLGPINTVTFIDKNRRFVTTSDDKTIRVWEWDIPVDFKYLADPSMHAIPTTCMSPGGKFMACQSMDNSVTIFNVLANFRQMRKKTFRGHSVAGYACMIDFSPDMSYLASGDADGKVFIWDWKSTRTFGKWKAHENVCMGVLWHPHETSKLLSCGWDGLVKLWD